MNTTLTLFFTLFLASTAAFGQEAYKCKVGGGYVYQDRPCREAGPAPKPAAPPAAPVPPVNQPDASQKTASTDPMAGAKAYLAERARDRKKTEIADIEEEIIKLRRNMSEEIDRLKYRKSYAKNNLAGAVWEQSISEEMVAVTTKYQIEIKTRQERMSRLRDDLAKTQAN